MEAEAEAMAMVKAKPLGNLVAQINVALNIYIIVYAQGGEWAWQVGWGDSRRSSPYGFAHPRRVFCTFHVRFKHNNNNSNNKVKNGNNADED